jgi:inner membrane transporter RhtA
VLNRIPPVWLVVIGILSVQWGAGLAKHVFDDATPTTLVWLRLTTSALILMAIARPVLRGRTSTDWLTVLAFGTILGIMNWAFYQSFARIPLGIAVTIEFLGPLSVAVLGSRRARDLVWVLLAALGVALLGLERGHLTWAGVLFALVAGACWAAYILLSAQTGRRWPGLEGLTVASVIASLAVTPFLLAGSHAGLGQPKVIAVGAVVGLLSSVIPYSCEITALRSLPPAAFGILMSMEPAVAALVGMLLIHEFLTVWQWVAVACVVAASAGATRTAGSTVAAPVMD